MRIANSFFLMLVISCMFLGNEAGAAWVVDTNTNIKLFDGPGRVNAGEFIVKTDQQGNNFQTERFRTFCVQINEYVSYGEKLDIYGISDVSKLGDNPLTARTSALYRAFMNGYAAAGTTANNAVAILGTTTYKFNGSGGTNNSNEADAGLMQKAIWKYQGQGSYVTSETASNNKFVAAIENLFSTWAPGLLASQLTGTDRSLWGNVKILNLYRTVGSNTHVQAQDQLYWDGSTFSGSPPAVPEPATVALYALGAFGMVWVGRRKMRNLPVA